VYESAVSATGEGRARVTIANRRDGGLVFWLVRLYGFAALTVIASIGLSGLVVYSYFSRNAPPVPDLRNYASIVPSAAYMRDTAGTTLA